MALPAIVIRCVGKANQHRRGTEKTDSAEQLDGAHQPPAAESEILDSVGQRRPNEPAQQTADAAQQQPQPGRSNDDAE